MNDGKLTIDLSGVGNDIPTKLGKSRPTLTAASSVHLHARRNYLEIRKQRTSLRYMKIAIIVNSFPPKWLAGTEIATYSMAKHLARKGHAIHVITSLDKGLPEESYESGFYVHRLPQTKIRFAGLPIFWVDIVKVIRKIDPDVVHVQSLYAAMPALISRKLLGIPYVVWGRGSDVYLPDWFTDATAKIIVENAKRTIALTGDMKRVMQTKYNCEVTVVPNGIDIDHYNGYLRMQVSKREIFAKKIIFVGRLHPVKGVPDLLMAMKLVKEEIPDIKLILVGDGEERRNLEDLVKCLGISECIEFIGKVPNEMISQYMLQADIFVLSSLSEGFPVSVLEAMACGLPIVATRVGGLPDIIQDGENGYLVNSRDPRDIAAKIIVLIKDNALRESISKTNREKVECYSWPRIVEQVEALYR